MESTETLKPPETLPLEIDPEHQRIYESIQAGTMTVEELSRLLDADGLIEGLNIKGFERRLNAYLEEGIGGALIAVDLDYFKAFNDSEGHPAGDDLLRLAGRILHDQTRTSEAEAEFKERRQNRREELDLLARGGDEFLVFLVEAGQSDSIDAAKRIRAAIESESKKAFPNYNRPQTMSLGLSVAKEGDNVLSLRSRADEALYEAKKGRGSVDIRDSIAVK
ncbi:GGDEF domain-containing protein [Candidatus Daviesbacteria bacterium]|nr:GGDEF domain-containing protein [Candidatus Daviesbacteria bacterium]